MVNVNPTIITKIEKARKQNTALRMAFVDLRKAFDSVWREELWKDFQHLSLEGKFSRIARAEAFIMGTEGKLKWVANLHGGSIAPSA